LEIPRIRSQGDVEVVVLYEAHGVLAEIIGPALYTIEGTPPDQTVKFNSRPAFDLFLVRLQDFIGKGISSPLLAEEYQDFSLMTGLRLLCAAHPVETREAGLNDSLSVLEQWLAKSVEVGFWCPNLETEVKFFLPNDQLIWFAANTARHNLARPSVLLWRLYQLCVEAGNEISPRELVGVLEGMEGEVKSRIQYHATYLLEMLGRLFQALNSLVNSRYRANPTSDVNRMTHPEGTTSDVFKDLNASLLVFKNYDRERIEKYTPVAAKHLRTRY
jgi:hypothetical protein